MAETDKKRRFRPWRFTLLAAASLLFAALALLVLVRLGTFDHLILAEASRRLEAAAGLRLTAEKIEVNPFILSVSLKNPALIAAADRDPILREFSADSLFLDVPKSLIFGGRLRFQRVHIVRPIAVLAPSPVTKPPTADAEISPPEKPTAVAEPVGFDLQIDELELLDGRVSWAGRTESIDVSLSHIDIAVNYDMSTQNNLVSFTSSEGHLSFPGREPDLVHLDLTHLDLKGSLGANDIAVEAFEITTAASSLSLAGTIKNYATAPDISGRASLSLSLPEMPFLAPLLAGAEGTLSAEASAQGKPENLAYEADIATTGLRTRDFGPMNLSGHVKGDFHSISVSGLDLRTDAGAVTGKFAADLSWKNFSDVDLEWTDLDPDRIRPLLPFLEKFPVSIGSLVSGHLVGKAKSLSLEDIDGSLSMTLAVNPALRTTVPEKSPLSIEGRQVTVSRAPAQKPTHGPSSDERAASGISSSERAFPRAESDPAAFPEGQARASSSPPEGAPSLRKPPLRLAGEIALHAAGGTFVADRARLSAAGASLEASGFLRPNGDLDGRYALMIESVPATVEALRLLGDLIPLPADLSSNPENLTGSVSVTGTIMGSTGAPAFTAQVEIPLLGYKALSAADFKADIAGNLNKLTVRDLSAAIAGGEVRAAGSFSLGESSDTGTPAVSLKPPPGSSSLRSITNRILPSERLTLELESIHIAEIASLLPEPWNEDTNGLFTGKAEITTGPGGLSVAFSAEARDLVTAGFGPRVPDSSIEPTTSGRENVPTKASNNLPAGKPEQNIAKPMEPRAAQEMEGISSPAASTGFHVPLLKFRGTYDASSLALDELLVETENGTLTGNGGYDLKGRTMAANLRSEGIGLEIFRPFLPPNLALTGRATINLSAEGEFLAPRGTLTLSVADFRAGSFTAPSLSLDAKSDGTSADASLRLPDYNSALTAKLTLAPPYTIEGKLTANGLPLDRLLQGFPDATTLNGQAGTSGSSFGKEEESGKSSEATNVSNPNSTTAASRNNIQDSQIGLETPQTASLLDLDGTFTYALADPSTFSTDVSFSGKDLSFGPPESFSAPEPSSPLSVSIDGRIQASGDPASPTTLTLSGELSRLLIALGDKSLTNPEPVRFHLGESILHIDSLALAGTGGSLSLTGTFGPLIPSVPAAQNAVRATENNSWTGEKEQNAAKTTRQALTTSSSPTLNARPLTPPISTSPDAPHLALPSSSVSPASIRPSSSPVLDARLHTDIDIAALSPLVSGMLIGGRLQADIDIRGESAAPSFSGRASLSDAFVRTDDFPLILSGLTAELSLDGSRLSLDKLEGIANGGPLLIQGGLDDLLSSVPPSARFTIDARNFQLNYPPGFRTTSDIALTLTGDRGEWTLAGDMKILRGLFREDISPGGQILGFGSYRWAQSESELPAFIRGIRLDIAVDTVEPIVFKNNLADVEILADLRVSGNPGLPLFSGRMRNAAVGEIVFGERRFVLETAQIDLLGQRVPDPNLEIVAHTQITHNLEPLDVRLQLSGSASDLRYSLTSIPPRSKEDLSLILLTGRSLEEVRGNAVNTLTTQTIQFFSSPIASPVTRALERVLKAEDISFEPLLISAEADPGARFTFRKRISEGIAVTYSADITSTQNQTLVLDYRLKRNFSFQAFRKDNGSYGGSLRHSIPLWLGSQRDTRAAPGTPGSRPILSALTFEGDPKLPAGEVDSALRRLSPGKPFSYSFLSDALDKLVKTYKKQGFANADVRPSVTTSDDGTEAKVHLLFAPGNPVRLVYSGDGISSRTRRAVQKNWTGLLPEDVNLDEARGLILDKLHRKGRYAARVEAEKRDAGNESVYEITVTKGPRYAVRGFSVDGNAALPTDGIRKATTSFPAAEYKGLWNLVYDPRSAIDAILGAYRGLGYSEARVRPPQVGSDPAARAVDIRLSVEEGPRRMVHDITFEGNTALSDAELRSVIETAKSKPFDPSLLPKDKDALLAFCRSRGFRQAQVEAEAVPHTGDPDVGVVFKVREGPVHTVTSLEVTGAQRTRAKLVLKTARIKQGDVFSFESLARGQKRLYDLSVFRAVNISTPERELESTEVPVTLDVREEPPLTFTYGLRYNSEDKLEGQVGLTIVNLLGGGRTGYLSYRQSSKVWDARFSVKLPYVLGLRADTRFSLSTTRERREAYISDELAGTIGQEARILKNFSLSVFYKLSRVREKEPDAAEFGSPVVLSEFSLNLIRDTRDDRFDPRDGSFLSLSVTGAPRIFGSGLPYIRAFTQYSFYRNLWGKVLWASNVRLGATTAFGEELLASRLFYAGGGTSIRGFEQDRVGPIDPLSGLPAGGKLVLLVNQELRIPFIWGFSGVVFYDIGNVYATLRDMSRFGLRQGLGAGLRAQSPIGLIRFDCGFNPFRRTGESKTVFFLSIGQAF